jgi:integrase
VEKGVIMAGIKKRRTSSGKVVGFYRDHTGKERSFSGTHDPKTTLLAARRLEDEHRLIHLGVAPKPTGGTQSKNRAITVAISEYISWGKSQGGRGGYPWSPKHANQRQGDLARWKTELNVSVLGDLDTKLAKAETILRDLSIRRSGRSVNSYVSSLSAFCSWMVDREYLDKNPFSRLKKFDETRKRIRRDPTDEEIGKILGVANHRMRLLYTVAMTTGFRKGELRSLSVDALDVKNNGLVLAPRHAKNRKPTFQPIPKDLVESLQEFSGEAKHYYRQFGGTGPTELPDDPLLFVPQRVCHHFKNDCKKAGVMIDAPGGTLDFHCLRVYFVNRVLAGNATLKESLDATRLSSADLLLKTYGRSHPGKTAEIAGKVFAKLPKQQNPGQCRDKSLPGDGSLDASAICG